MSSSNSRSVPIHNNEYYARSPEVRYKNTSKRKSTPVTFNSYAKYYNYTNPARNSNQYQKRFITPPTSPFRYGFGSPSPPRIQSPRISKKRREENEKLEAARKRNENKRRKEAAAAKKAKEEAAKKPKSLEQQLKSAKTLSNLKKIYKKGALIKHPNKGGTKNNFQKWKSLFDARKSIINLK
tara:strand:+ start:16 stop:561 length:546 start_codon:yes stop_codon:yes gene_type:complete